MKLFITLAIASLGFAGVFSQGLGGYGGYEEHDLGGGGYHSKGSIIGLSRGIEIEHHGHGGGEEGGEGGHGGGEEGGLELGGGGGGGGGGEGGEEKGHGHYGIGWGESLRGTPVDVHHEEVVHLKAHPEYKYDYKVADHKHKDYKTKEEHRDGYKVKGRYTLLEPDHKTIRVVDYTSDKKQGFIAKVSYRKHN